MDRRAAPRWTFKAIVSHKDNWQRYQEVYAGRVTAHQIAGVEKMLRCGDARYGFMTYVCLSCGEEKRVAFSCKSRVCSSCGKVHADEWAKQLSSRLFNVSHRHTTFTVPSDLWSVLEEDAARRKVLFPAANATLLKVMHSVPGIAMVMHPYGKDLKVNYHLHVLVTEGGLDERGRWQDQTYFNYTALRKIWQYEVLTRLRQLMPAGRETSQMIDRLFRQYRQGWYVHAEPRISDGKGISRYIGRYIRHPAIADARIVAYDGESVTFYYEVREGKYKVRRQETWPVLDFIHGVVRHIPPKQFKLVRYYGLYAPRQKERVREILAQLSTMMGRSIRRLSWRARIRRDFQQDPLRCPCCGEPDMELYSLTVLCGGRLVTIGGWQWLLARGAVKPERPPPVQPQPVGSPGRVGVSQLCFTF